MTDVSNGMIRDSDIKYYCRALIFIISDLDLSIEQKNLLIDPIGKIVKAENERLDGIKHD